MNDLQKENILSYCILIVAISLVILYSFVISYVQNAQNEQIRRKVSALSILVPSCFIVLTLPYTIYSLSLGERAPKTVNGFILVNSGVNSILYFFKKKYKRKRRLKLPVVTVKERRAKDKERPTEGPVNCNSQTDKHV